jgi:hypothetical protein
VAAEAPVIHITHPHTMSTIQSGFSKMLAFAAQAMGNRFAVLQYDRALDGLSIWEW